MSAFGGLVLTTKGRNLQAKAQAGTQLNFTRIAVGDGELEGSSILELNILKHEVKTLNITKLKPLTGGKAAVGGMLSNQGLLSGFSWCELGLFALDPDLGEILYCYGNAGVNAEYIPADGGSDVLEKSIDIISIVGDVANVTATIDQSLIFASVDELNALSVEVAAKETPAGAQTKATEAETNAKAYTDAKVAALVDASPATLDTLNELAAALGDDPNFATTVLNQIAAKADASALAAHQADNTKQVPHLGTTTNIGNNYSVVTAETILVNQKFTVLINAASTGVSTLNVSTIGSAGGIKKPGGLDASLKVGAYTLFYDGVNFQLLGEGGEYGNVTADKVVAGVAFGTEEGLALGTYDKVAGVGDKVMIANYIMPVGITGGYELLSQYPEVLRQVVDYSGLTIGAYNPQYIAYIQNSYISSRFKIVSSFTTTVLDLAGEVLAATNCQSAYDFSTEFATVDTKLYFVRSGSPQYIQCYNAYNVLLASNYIPSTYTTSYDWSILPGGVVSFRYGDYIYLRKIDSTIDTTNTLILGTQQTAFSQAPTNGRIIDGYLYLHLGTWKLVKIDLTTLTIVAETTDSRIVNKRFVNNNVTTEPNFYIFNYSNPGKLYKVDKNTLEVLVEGASVSFQGDMFVKDVGHPTAILVAGYTSQAAYSMCVYLLDKTTLALIQAWYVDDTTSSSIPNGTYKFRGLDGAYDSTGGYFYSKGLLYNPNNSSYYAKWAIHSFCPFSTILLTM